MLIQEKISGSDTLLKLYVAIDEDLKVLKSHLQAHQLPRGRRGGTPILSATEVPTILVGGAWLGVKARLRARVARTPETIALAWPDSVATVLSVDAHLWFAHSGSPAAPD